MADAAVLQLIATASALRRSHPGVPALDVLDLAMQGRHGAHFNTDAHGEPWDDWLDPPSPLARLLRDAFAPQLADDPYFTHNIWTACDAQGVLLATHWDEQVLHPFATRYGLWEP